MAVLKLLRDVHSREWLTEDGSFTKDQSHAAAIDNFLMISRLSRQFPERHLEIVIKLPTGEQLSLPLD